MSSTMYVITHRDFECPNIKDYVPLAVGCAMHERNLPYLRDDSGDHISMKNANYCELTGLYWIWKNSDADVVGFCHYRRYFSKYLLDQAPEHYLEMSRAQELLQDCDIILPSKMFWRKQHNVAMGYYLAGEGREKDLFAVENILQTKYPGYVDAYKRILNARSASYCNMMICSKKVLDAYCAWLFDVLGDLEKTIEMSDYTKSEARVFGYLSEILLNVWVEANGLKANYLPFVVNKPLSRKKQLLMQLEKIPVVRHIAKTTLCADLAWLDR